MKKKRKKQNPTEKNEPFEKNKELVNEWEDILHR